MKTLAIDFAPTSWFRRLRRVPVWQWCALLLTLLWLLISLLTQLDALRSLDAQASELSLLQSKLQRRVEVKPLTLETSVTPNTAKAVNLAIEKLNLPWRDLFDSLESATPKHIALLSIEPDARRHLLRANAEAKDSDAMTAYLKGLRDAGFFTEVLLRKHEINEADPNRPLRFQFEAQWQGQDDAADNVDAPDVADNSDAVTADGKPASSSGNSGNAVAKNGASTHE